MYVGANPSPGAGSRKGVIAIVARSRRRDERGLPSRLIVAFVNHDLQLLRDGSKELLSFIDRRMAEPKSLIVREKTTRSRIFRPLVKVVAAWIRMEERRE
jgi:hypothetical protein